MIFYYTSTFSVLLLGITYAALALLIGGIAYLTRNVRRQKIILVGIAAVFLVLPVSEELWTAWNFGQACKGAGTFIFKTVRVDGFYDSTRITHAGTPTPQAVKSFEHSGYRFLEMRGQRNYVRVERTDDGQWKATTLDHPTAR
jgi:hypothetical protein